MEYIQLTNYQSDLLSKLADLYKELSEECMVNEDFHDVMIANNDLFPMSLDEMRAEWLDVSRGEKRERFDREEIEHEMIEILSVKTPGINI